MHCRISPRRTCNPCGYTMKISCRHHRLLIYDVKRTNKIDGMGPFNGIENIFHTQNRLQLIPIILVFTHYRLPIE